MHTGWVTSVQHGRGRRPAEDGRRTSSPTRPPAHQSIWPGLLLAVFGGVLSVAASRVIPALSALLVAIILGALLANSPMARVAGLLERTHAGLAVAARRVLRIGIVLLGLQLALGDIVGLGWPMLVGVVLIVAGGIGATVVVGRALRLTSTQTLLIACGFSICGAAAVAAADGVLVRRRSEETVTALALVVVYGTMMIPLVPATAALLGLGDSQAGIFAGGAIHEVAQVVAAGGIIGGPALGIAVVVKLARVLMLAPVLAVLTLTQRTNRPAGSEQATQPPLVPLFVIGFIAMVAVRSTGLLPGEVLEVARVAQVGLLSTAMFALGCSVRVATLRAAGLRPILLGGFATAVVTGLAYAAAAVGGA